MKIKELVSIIEETFPRYYAEDFDNTGLLVGDSSKTVTGVLVTLDTLEAVVDEAIEQNCNFIFSFHPIIFKGLKKITGKNYVERVVLKAIKNDIAIYAIHTALDNHWDGVNAKICDRLQLKNRSVLIPQKNTLKKLSTYVPIANFETLREALCKAGAGAIGNYSDCSFSLEGTGTYKPLENANPTLGSINKLHREPEMQLQLVFPAHLERKIVTTLKNTHPYEEVAYEIYAMENTNSQIGMGMVGDLKAPLSEDAFLSFVKKEMNTKCIRHSNTNGNTIKRVAVLGGSGSFAIEAAQHAGADAFITADLKYHDFYRSENRILLTDIGHYESEQFTKELLVAVLNKKITNFAVVLSQLNTNPITYF